MHGRLRRSALPAPIKMGPLTIDMGRPAGARHAARRQLTPPPAEAPTFAGKHN